MHHTAINSKIATKLICIVPEHCKVYIFHICSTGFFFVLVNNCVTGMVTHGCDSNHTVFSSTWSDATPSHAHIALHLNCFECSPSAPPYICSQAQHSTLPNKGPEFGPGSQTIYTVRMSWCWRGICCGLKLHMCILNPRWQYRGVRQMGHTH